MVNRTVRAPAVLGALLISALAAACSGDGTSPPQASAIAAVSGDGQLAALGQRLPDSLVVRVTDAQGSGMAGVQVTWSVTSGGGSVSPASTVTDQAGAASTAFTLGTAAAGPEQAQASVTGVTGSPVVFTATGVVTGPSGSIVLVDSLPIPADYGIHDTYVRDGLAFVSAWNTGLRIYDVGNGIRGGSPANPQLVGSIVTAVHNPSGGASVHNSWWFHNPVSGEARYLFIGEEGPSGGIGVSATGDIHVVDVSDLAHPVEVAYYHMPDVDGQPAGTHNFWVDEAHQVLYAAYYNGGVIALDVSGTLSGDLSSRLLAQARPGGAGQTFVWGVQQAPDGSLYATDMVSGFWHLQLNGGSFTVLGGGGNVPERYSSDLWVANGYAYTGTWRYRGSVAGNVLKVWRLGGGAPELVDSVVTPGYITVSDVEVAPGGQLLLVTGESGVSAGLYLYSLAEPAHPRLVASRLVQSGSQGLHTGTFATIDGRLYVFTARDPSDPALLIFDVSSVVP